jgi:hypothetical protein
MMTANCIRLYICLPLMTATCRDMKAAELRDAPAIYR